MSGNCVIEWRDYPIERVRCPSTPCQLLGVERDRQVVATCPSRSRTETTTVFPAPRPSVNSNAGSKDTNREYEVGGDMNVNDVDDKQNWSFLFSHSIMTRVIYICSFTVSGRPFGMLKQYFVCRDDVFIRDWPYLFGWDTSNNRILRDIMKYHGSGTYHSMITYRHAPTDGSMRTYPNTVADRYRLRRFYSLISLFSHDWVTGTSEDYSGRNEAHVANRYWTRVKEGNSKVHIGHAQEMGVESKVEVNAMLDHNSFVIRTEYLLEQFLSALCIRRTGLIIFQY